MQIATIIVVVQYMIQFHRPNGDVEEALVCDQEVKSEARSKEIRATVVTEERAKVVSNDVNKPPKQ
jgi:hypothetical protein